MKRYLLLLIFMAASFSAYSSTSVHPAFDGFMQRVGASSTTVSFASTGQPILVSSRHLGNPHIGAMGLTPGPNGVTLRSSGGLTIPGKNGTIPVIASTVFSRTLLGRAVEIAIPMLTLASGAMLVNDADAVLQAFGFQRNQDNTLSRAPFNWLQACRELAQNQLNTTSVRNFFCDLERRNRVFDGPDYLLWHYRVNGVADSLDGRRTFISANLPFGRCRIISGQGTTNPMCVDDNPTLEQLADNIARQSSWPDSALLAATRIAANPAIAPQLLPEKQRLPLQLEFPGGHQSLIVEEAEPQVVTRTRVLPDGNIETKTQTTQRVARIQPTTQATPSPTVQFEEQTVTKRKVTTPTGQIVLPEETVSTETKPQPQEQPPNCGLPNTPPCRIYEPHSMPRAPVDDSATILQNVRTDIEQCLSDIPDCLNLPDIDFSFSMPSACSSLSLPAFKRWMEPIDICSYKPYFHSIMGMVWAITGVFGAMAIIGRRF